MEALLVLYSGICNRARGDDDPFTNKALMSFAFGFGWLCYALTSGYSTTQSAVIGLITSLGFLIGNSKGWTFKALHGRNDSYIKFPLIGDLVTKIYGPQVEGDKVWGIIFMTFRGVLYLPMYIALGIYLHTFSIAGIGSLLMGVLLYLCGFIPVREDRRHELYEFLYFVLHGVLLVWVI